MTQKVCFFFGSFIFNSYTLADIYVALTGELKPPPEACFLTEEDVYNFCQRWAKGQGYAFFKDKGHPGKNLPLKCVHFGIHVGKIASEKQRNTATKKTGCGMWVYAKKPAPKKAKKGQEQERTYWQLEHRVTEHFGHSAATNPGVHPVHRRLNPDQTAQLTIMAKTGASNKQISQILRENTVGTYATSKTISNVKQKLRIEDLGDKTPMQQLMQVLDQYQWSHNTQVHPNGQVANMFFAHPASISLAKIFHHVCVVDATYKTNRFNMPLLHAVSQTSTGQTFTIGFCVMSHEDEASYIWAMSQFKNIWHPNRQPQVFVIDRDVALSLALRDQFPDTPQVLCSWHIAGNIRGNCRKDFQTENEWDNFEKHWLKVVHSKTEQDFDFNLQVLEGLLLPKHPQPWRYLNKNILPFKEVFMDCRLNDHPHLGNKVTSRAEGAHSFIKKFIQVPTGEHQSLLGYF